jgi:hypothetical protein
MGEIDGVVSVQTASHAPADGIEETAGRRVRGVQKPGSAVGKGRSADFSI